VKSPYLPQVSVTEAATEAGREVGSQATDDRFSVGGSIAPALLKFNDPTPNLPIRSGHQPVNTARGGAARGFQERHDRPM
jgi:hypothetical protein